VEKADWK